MGRWKHATRGVILGLVACVAIGVGRMSVHDDPASPLVIAHRGASGYLPEHTLAAYAMAYAQGADLIEPDVVATNDGVLVCSHDLTLERTTDVAQRFPGRAREDGRFYVIDFTLAELKTLSKHGGVREGEAPAIGFQIATLDEMLALVDRLNRRTGRSVGIIPEMKSPAWHEEQGFDLVRGLHAALSAHGYSTRTDPAIVQCFELNALRRMRVEMGCDLRLAYLAGDEISDATLDEVASFCDAIGPSRKLVEDDAGASLGLVERAHARGLGVYPYTIDNEPDAARRFFGRHHVEGIFINYPDVGVAARDDAAKE